MFVLLHPISRELPHSSSGPGHLPLTQKIISSTLICGTKPPQVWEAFFIWSCHEKIVILHLVLWDAFFYIWPIMERVIMGGKLSQPCPLCSRRSKRPSQHCCDNILLSWVAEGPIQASTPAISMLTSMPWASSIMRILLSN